MNTTQQSGTSELEGQLLKLQQMNGYELLFMSDHTDDEYDDLDVFLKQTEMCDILENITHDAQLYNTDVVLKYLNLHDLENINYLHPDILVLLFYIIDDNEYDTKNVSSELKSLCEESLNYLKNVLEFPENDVFHAESASLTDRIFKLQTSLQKSIPLVCEFMLNSSEQFENTNLYQQLLNQMLGPDANNILNSLMPEGNETEDAFQKILNNLIPSKSTQEQASSNEQESAQEQELTNEQDQDHNTLQKEEQSFDIGNLINEITSLSHSSEIPNEMIGGVGGGFDFNAMLSSFISQLTNKNSNEQENEQGPSFDSLISDDAEQLD